MALPLQDNAEFRDATGKAADKRASSGDESSAAAAAMSSPELEDAAATPPPMQLMERQSSSSSDGDGGGEPGRIPAAVFERDEDPSGSNKDWSMMSTESVFGLQVAPSSDFTGFFLAHPELMDIATPPRTSAAVDADADAASKSPVSPPFDSIPELPETTMTGNYSFAFPNLIEDKRNFSKKTQQEEQPPEAVAAMEPAEVAPAPAQPETQAQRPASSKPEAAPVPEAGKGGGLFSCFPCC